MPDPQYLTRENQVSPQSMDSSESSQVTAATMAPPAFQLKADPVQKKEGDSPDSSAAYEPKAGDKISKSVGAGGVNSDKDVRIVQYNLVNKGYLAATREDGTSSINGICDEATEYAIRQVQIRVVEAKTLDAKVDPGGKTEKALNGEITKSRPDLVAGEGMIDQIAKDFPNGVNVAIWANYDDQNSNNKEFKRAADTYASSFNSLGYDDKGNLKLGMARPIKSQTDVINAINDIHNLLVSEYEKSVQQCVAVPPAFTKIKTLALFSHGMPWGMHLAGSGKYNTRIDTAKEEKQFELFVKDIKGPLKSDVDVNLFACNAGRESDGTEKGDVWSLSAAEKQDGSSSFGAKFAEELGPEASVYAHLSAGHTVNNYSARVFGADAGKDATQDQGGVHIFRLLYDDAFITSEATRLQKDKAKVEKQMWKHYTSRMSESHNGKLSIPQADGTSRKVQLGSEMFSNLEGTTTFLHQDWATWVQTNPVQ
ncbi:MAG: hypothetical protein H6581_30310 [Bacteroidia bacterium]|nr:hypothetical protein [Bacteroidia bacterium]